MPENPGENMEWAAIGPLDTAAECEANASRWPINITDCFSIDGQWYFYAVRQATH